MDTPHIPVPEPGYIFVASITTRDGKKLWARNYGLKAFRIKARLKPPAKVTEAR